MESFRSDGSKKSTAWNIGKVGWASGPLTRATTQIPLLSRLPLKWLDLLMDRL